MCVGLRGAALEGYIIMFPAVMVCLMDLIFYFIFIFNLVCLFIIIRLNAFDVAVMFTLHFVSKIKEP